MTDTTKVSLMVLPEEKSRVTFLSGITIIANNFLQGLIPKENTIPILFFEAAKQSLQNCTDILLAAYSSQETERRLKLLVEQANNNFSILEKKIEKLDPTYGVVIEKVFRETIRTPLNEKIKILADVLTNTTTIDINRSQIEWILVDAFSMTVEHIAFLSEAMNYRNTAEFKTTPFAKTFEIGDKIGFSNALTQKIANDLLSKGILNDPMVGTWDYSGMSQFAVSEYGQTFYEYIKTNGTK